MKRFWKRACALAEDGGWIVQLDEKPLRTPARRPLIVPVPALAEAIVGEWNAAGDRVDPAAMPMTGLANAATDRVAVDREAFAAGLATYGESDLLCYRADYPGELRLLQEAAWDPLLEWARRRFEVEFVTARGIVHVAQPVSTVRRLARSVAALDQFSLAGLSPLVTIGGSLVAALAVLDEAVPADRAWDSVSVDERWQLGQWGLEGEAKAALDGRRGEFMAAARFLELVRG